MAWGAMRWCTMHHIAAADGWCTCGALNSAQDRMLSRLLALTVRRVCRSTVVTTW